ncbi:MAG: hypothetical protein Q8Q52_05575 [Acidimicrobiia bacterium]|nr:hypothetical protein [Acidimicrobiia bacterium]
MAHVGLLALEGEDRPIRAQLDFTDTDLTIAVASGPLGSWPLSSCRIEPNGDRFVIDVDGDVAWFRPDDPAAFARDALAHGRAGGLASAVKTARMASPPSAPAAASVEESEDAREQPLLSWWRSLGDGKKNLVLAGAGVVIGIIVIALIAGGPQPATTIVTVPITPTTSPITAFDLDLGTLSMRWNEVSADLGLDLFILGVPTGNRMEVDLGAGITLYATEDPATDRVRTLMVAAGPGEAEQAEAVLAAWGSLIALVNPDLSPQERRDVLDRLGVDVERPLQLGLMTETEQDGVRYWLRSGVLGNRVLLGVETAR